MKINSFLDNVLNTTSYYRKFEGGIIRPAITPDILPYSNVNHHKKEVYRHGLSNRIRSTNYYPTNEPSYNLHDSAENDFNIDNENYYHNNNNNNDSSFNAVKYNTEPKDIDKVLKINLDKTSSQQEQKDQHQHIQQYEEEQEANTTSSRIESIDVKNDILLNNFSDKKINNDNNFTSDGDISPLKGIDKQSKIIESDISPNPHPSSSSSPSPSSLTQTIKSPLNYINNIYNNSKKNYNDNELKSNISNNDDMGFKIISSDINNHSNNEDRISREPPNLNLQIHNKRNIDVDPSYDLKKKVFNTKDSKFEVLKINSDNTSSSQQEQEQEQKESKGNISSSRIESIDVKNDILLNNFSDKSTSTDNNSYYERYNSNPLKGIDKKSKIIESEISILQPHQQSIKIHKYKPLSDEKENFTTNYEIDPTITVNIERIIIRGKYNSNNTKGTSPNQMQNNNSKGLSLNDYLNKRDKGKI